MRWGPTRMVTLVALLHSAPAERATAQTSDATEALKWEVATLLPPGAKLAVLAGDPRTTGVCTMLVSMPDGYRLPPHSHPTYEHVEVMEGTLLVGVGDRLDPTHTLALATGDSATAPAGIHHFSIAKGKTLLEVTFIGPYTITYVRAEDAPHERTFPYGY